MDAGKWVLRSPYGFENLTYEETSENEPLGPQDVLVRLHAASLNSRELYVLKGARLPAASAPMKSPLVPSSDGAGVVVEIGRDVTLFKPGDKVITHLAVHIPDDALPVMDDIQNGLGHLSDGTLRRLGTFHHSALAHMPQNLSFAEAATLTCSGLTAWNALMGLPGRPVRSGDFVVVQGTGGVSVAALQIAVAAGATVIATTSSDAKAARLRALGATHVVNYRTTPEWGHIVRSLTPEGRGADFVVEIGGPSTLAESIAAIRTNGVVALTGASGGWDDSAPNMMQVLTSVIILRGVLLGTRQMMREFVEFIHEKGIKPALDDIAFEFENVKAAYERLDRKEHFSKVVIKIQPDM
ncbi:hypothetical protein PFICI_06528 [Pestalotiopsis fici W106-1]|uniref:Enoyl reductase (ER) domain-containing protein n=1 Tax=Pestalotiopsis fici (strain W106-1 / CGMCC3.15140) TaxID=1229662 RepID=W3X8K8_PESFW|nr:uncharacterized protein PFICI_06528 [Pestalotiopsis fici W106-1]ETS81526.1 hypothetical protein PFICI_06528 [Pestalotiopsis fici W106-1]